MGVEDQIIVEESTEPPICGYTDVKAAPTSAGLSTQRSPTHPPARPADSDEKIATAAGAPSVPPPHTVQLRDLETVYQTSFGNGLSNADAADRLAQDGPNTVKGAKGLSLWEILLRQVSNSLTLVLFIVMALSFAINDYIEGAVIAAVILLNIVVGCVPFCIHGALLVP